jgi:dipeptidyl aminopeptidase/acylaminoacyl peptidase
VHEEKECCSVFEVTDFDSYICVSGKPSAAPRASLQNDDLYRLRSVNEVHFSVDSRHIAYSVTMRDRPGHPRWSPDGKMIACSGEEGGKRGLMLAHADGSRETFLAPSIDTNSPLPNQGESFTWSPDSKKIAFISATPGPETYQHPKNHCYGGLRIRASLVARRKAYRLFGNEAWAYRSRKDHGGYPGLADESGWNAPPRAGRWMEPQCTSRIKNEAVLI